MENIEYPIVFTPNVFGDERGYFMETYKKDAVFNNNFVQDNESKSQKGVLRGLHFQSPPFAQAKLVRVVRGSAVDVIVDIRKGSPTYGKVYECFLSEENHTQFYVPRGFAHGFLALEDNTIFQYKCDNVYNKESEGGVAWDSIDYDWKSWHEGDFIISDKDKDRVKLSDFDSPFILGENC